MPEFGTALSSFSDYLTDKYKGFSDWAGLHRKKYYLEGRYRFYSDYLKTRVSSYGKAYLKYFLFEFTPFVLAYGLMLNFPLSVLAGWAFTGKTVVSWGLVVYMGTQEVYPRVQDLLN